MVLTHNPSPDCIRVSEKTPSRQFVNKGLRSRAESSVNKGPPLLGTSGAASWCRREAVAPHHFDERCGVGRAASCGLDDGSHLAEVVRAEDAGGDDREHLRVDAMIVVEAVDDSARDTEHLTRANVGLSSVERPG